MRGAAAGRPVPWEGELVVGRRCRRRCRHRRRRHHRRRRRRHRRSRRRRHRRRRHQIILATYPTTVVDICCEKLLACQQHLETIDCEANAPQQ